MLPCILIALRCTRIGAAVHAAAALISYRRLAAGCPGSRLGAASGRLVHQIDKAHGIVPRFLRQPLPGLGKTLGTAEVVFEPIDDAKALHAAYAEAFATLSGDIMTLAQLFADQRLAGGHHYRHRFMRSDYLPWVLTGPGSAFVLDVVPGRREEALAWLLAIERHGLDVPHRLLPEDEREELFLQLPFLRQNGYGEVAIDLDRRHPDLDPGRRFQSLGAAA